DLRQNVLAGGGGGGDAQASLAPFAEAFDGFGGGIERAERALDLREQLFTGLVEDHAFADALEQAAAEVSFEGFEAMADGRRSEMHFTSGDDEAAAFGHGAENSE